MKNTYLTLILTSLVTITGPCVEADVVWSADFESYDTSGGSVPVTFNSSGDSDTFSGISTNSNMSITANDVSSTGVPSFMSGNALFVEGTTTAAGLGNYRLSQSALPGVGSPGTYVVSYDFYNTGASYLSLLAEANIDTGRAGNTLYLNNGLKEALRVTIVINNTDSTVALPARLAETTLAANSMVAYTYDGTTFNTEKFSDGNITSSSISGFSIGASRRDFVEGDTPSIWLDNLAVWNSVTDTVNGTSILELAPGTVIPEVSSSAMLLGLLAVPLVILWHRRSSKS